MRAYLYTRTDSWNVVSMDGGADDTNWTNVMKWWYPKRVYLGSGTDVMPWTIANRVNCPDSDTVFDSLLANKGGIKVNLTGVATVAHRASPGVRILDVGYPYVHNQSPQTTAGNTCSGNASSTDIKPFVGSKAIIDRLNYYHQAVTGSSIRYVDLAQDFGTNPVASNYLQLTRLYGWPHASGAGQARISSKAQAVLADPDLAW